MLIAKICSVEGEFEKIYKTGLVTMIKCET